MKRRTFLAASMLCSATQLARAGEKYPSRPIRLIVPFSAGAGVDAFGRALSQQLTLQLGVSVIVENKPGAGGMIGEEYVASSAADGYTLFASTNNSVYLTPQVVKHGRFDPMTDLVPVIAAAVTPMVIVVNPSVPVHNAKELIEYAKQSRTPVSFATAGVGTLNQLIGEALALVTGAKFLHVPYRGGAPALTDALAGRVPICITILTSASPYIDNGKLRAIAVVESHRSKFRPDIPTLKESGVNLTMPATGLGIWAPAKTPATIIQYLNTAMQKALSNAALQTTLEHLGLEIRPLGVEASAQEGRELFATYKTWVEKTKLAPNS